MVVNSEDLSSSVYTLYSDAEGLIVPPSYPFNNPYGSGFSGLYKGTGQTGKYRLSIRTSGVNSTYNFKPNTQYVCSVFIKRIQNDSAERYITLATAEWNSFAAGAKGTSGVFDLKTGTRVTKP